MLVPTTNRNNLQISRLRASKSESLIDQGVSRTKQERRSSITSDLRGQNTTAQEKKECLCADTVLTEHIFKEQVIQQPKHLNVVKKHVPTFGLQIIEVLYQRVDQAALAVYQLFVYLVGFRTAFAELIGRRNAGIPLVQPQPQPQLQPQLQPRSTKVVHQRPTIRVRGRPAQDPSYNSNANPNWNGETSSSNNYSYTDSHASNAAWYAPCPDDSQAQVSMSQRDGVMGSFHGAPQVQGALHPRQGQQHLNAPSNAQPTVPSQNANSNDQRVPIIFSNVQDEGGPIQGRQCDICGLKIRRPGMLDDHLNTHAGLRPHICPICGVGFAQRGNVGRHMQSVHKCKQL